MEQQSRIFHIVSLGLAALAIVAVGILWLRTRTDLEAIRAMQRDLVRDVAALNKTPILDISNSPGVGAMDAAVALIEFSDYECPFCIRHFQQTMPQIDTAYLRTGKVRYVFRDLPIDQLHPGAVRAHEAAHCAIEQSKFWELHGRLFSAPGTHTDQALEQRAGEAGLNVDSFKSCLASGRVKAAVRRNIEQANSLGANGTPAFFIGVRDRATGQMRVIRAISGARPFEVFQQALDEALARKDGT